MKKNLIIILLILTNLAFLALAYAQMTIAKKQTTIANRQWNLANQYKIESDSLKQELFVQQKTMADKDSIIMYQKKLIGSNKSKKD